MNYFYNEIKLPTPVWNTICSFWIENLLEKRYELETSSKCRNLNFQSLGAFKISFTLNNVFNLIYLFCSHNYFSLIHWKMRESHVWRYFVLIEIASVSFYYETLDNNKDFWYDVIWREWTNDLRYQLQLSWLSICLFISAVELFWFLIIFFNISRKFHNKMGNYNPWLNIRFFLVLCLLPLISPSNILVISPTISKSHFKVGETISIGLAKAGHNVTIISPYDYKPTNPNIEPIQTTGVLEKAEGKEHSFTSFSCHDLIH